MDVALAADAEVPTQMQTQMEPLTDLVARPTASDHGAATAAPLDAVPSAPAMATAAAETIAVCIRLRPLNEREVRNKDTPVLRAMPRLKLVSVTDRQGQPLQGKHNVFPSDHIFDASASTRAMYTRVAQRIVHSALGGINGTIFAYGQTSSGKTYTMTGKDAPALDAPDAGAGPPSPSPVASMGILQLAVDDIFRYIEESTDRDFLLRVSFVEIHNEVVKDLLTTHAKGQNLKLREDPRKGVYVDCHEEIITTFDDIRELLRAGNQRRTVGTTAMNDRSSRSHSIFRIVIESKEKASRRRESESETESATAKAPPSSASASARSRHSEEDMNGAVLVGCLSLVDLAGSESVRHTAAEGQRQREAGNINKSLLTLSRVINSLATATGPDAVVNAPFRDSKLTRLLQNSLGGNTRTLIICCVTPSDRYLEETRSTLQFAARAKTIKTSAMVNEILDDQAQLKRLKREVHELKAMAKSDALSALRAENEALQHEKNRHKAEIARLLGLMLSGSSLRRQDAADTANGDGASHGETLDDALGQDAPVLSVRRRAAAARARNKRTRETWCPGDFTSLAGELAATSPSTKRRVDADSWRPRVGTKENVDPQVDELPMWQSRADADEVAELDRTVTESMDAGDGDGEGVAQLTGLLDRLQAVLRGESNEGDDDLADAMDAEEDDEEPLDDATFIDRRVNAVVRDVSALLQTTTQAEALAGENEVLKMAVEEMRTRMQLVDAETAAARRQQEKEGVSAKEELVVTLEQLERQRGTVEKLQSRVTELEQRLESDIGSDDKPSLSEDHAAVAELQAHLEELQQREQDSRREHQDAVEEIQASADARINELAEQLEQTVASMEELREQTQQEASRLENALQTKTDELDEAHARFAERESELLHAVELAESTRQQVSQDNESDSDRAELVEKARMAEAKSAALESENARLVDEQTSLSEAMEALEAQLQETALYQGELQVQVNTLEAQKATLSDQLAVLRAGGEVANENEDEADATGELSEELKRLRITVDSLEQRCAVAEADAHRHAEEAQELRKQLEVTSAKINEFDSLQASIEDYKQKERMLQALVDAKEEAMADLAASEREAQSYKDFVQMEMDEVSHDKEMLSQENSVLRDQLEEMKREVDRAVASDELVSEMEQLREGVDSLQAELDRKLTQESEWKAEIRQLLSRAQENARDMLAMQRQLRALERAKTKAERRANGEESNGDEDDDSASDEGDGADGRSSLEQAQLAVERASWAMRLAELQEKTQELTTALNAARAEAAQKEKDAAADAAADADAWRELEEKMEELEQENRSLQASLRAHTNETSVVSPSSTEAVDVTALKDRVVKLTKAVETAEHEKQELSDAIKAESNAKAELTEELTALEAQLMEVSTERLDLQRRLDDQAVNGSPGRTTEDGSVQYELTKAKAELERLTEQLDVSTRRGESLAKDVASYEETCELLRSQVNGSSTASRSLELAAEEHNTIRQQLESELKSVREQLQRAMEEQEELRYQRQEQQRQVAMAMVAKEESVDALHVAETNVQGLKRTVAEMEEKLRQAEEAKTLAHATSEELERLTSDHKQLEADKERLEAEIVALEAQWRRHAEELRSKSDFELSTLRDQLKEAQDELESYQRYADSEINKLQESVAETNTELQEVNERASERDEEWRVQLNESTQMVERLKLQAEELISRASSAKGEAYKEVEAVARKHAEVWRRGVEAQHTAAVNELRGELEEAIRKRDELVSATADQAELAAHSHAEMKALVEKLEGEAYQHRNEREELAETLKSAQMEAMHYHSQLVESQQKMDKLNETVETQRLRIAKLDEVKMTNAIRDVFRNVKKERDELLVRVQALKRELARQSESIVSEIEEKEEKERKLESIRRVVTLKEEEVAMLKQHVTELQDALANERKRMVEVRRDLQRKGKEIAERMEQEITDMKTELTEKSAEAEELQQQLQETRHALQETRRAQQSSLAKENVEPRAEDRKRTVAARSLHPASSSSLLTDAYKQREDGASSKRSATSLLDEKSTMGVVASDSKQGSHNEMRSGSSSAGGFLLPSTASAEYGDVGQEEEARPACAQQ